MTITNRILLTTCLLLLLPAFASAATLNIHTNTNHIRVGDTFMIGISLNTHSAVINAIDGSLTLSSNLKLVSVRLAGSLVPLWITAPAEQTANVINFAGILPGGYKSVSIQSAPTQGNVFTLILTAVSSGVARISFGPHTAAYLNDGKGTPASLTASALTFPITTISHLGEKTTITADTTPPEPFTSMITSGKPFGYKGKVLVFVAQDKDSSILSYEIAQSYLKSPKISDLLWKHVKSPYVLRPSDSDKFLFIRAIDSANNTRISEVSPQYMSMSSFVHRWWIFGLILLFGVILFYLAVRLFHR